MKQYEKLFNKDGECFKYITRMFPKLSNEKTYVGIFDDPETRKLLNDSNFTNCTKVVELSKWDQFVWGYNKMKFFYFYPNNDCFCFSS